MEPEEDRDRPEHDCGEEHGSAVGSSDAPECPRCRNDDQEPEDDVSDHDIPFLQNVCPHFRRE